MADSEKGIGKIKAATAGLGFLAGCFGLVAKFLGAIGAVAALSDTGHAILSTFVMAFFIVYVVIDMIYWRGEVAAIWIIGPLTILVAACWWVGFLAKHHIPATPLLPAHLYPPDWGYIIMFGWLALYCTWDIVDAKMHRYRDEKHLVLGAVVLLFGAAICLFLTLRGPQGS